MSDDVKVGSQVLITYPVLWGLLGYKSVKGRIIDSTIDNKTNEVTEYLIIDDYARLYTALPNGSFADKGGAWYLLSDDFDSLDGYGLDK